MRFLFEGQKSWPRLKSGASKDSEPLFAVRKCRRVSASRRLSFPCPPDRGEVLHASRDDDDAFGQQQRSLSEEIAAVPSETSAGGDDAMAGNRRVVAVAHDVPDGAVSPRTARGSGDIAVGGDAPARNPPDGGSYARGKIRHRHIPSRHLVFVEAWRTPGDGE